jgi:arylsulfatase A-like enzyme
MVGKWHLGFWYELPEGAGMPAGKKRTTRAAPVGTRVVDGPVARGFDFFRGFHHAGEMRTWIEQDTVTENLKSAEEMLPKITNTAVGYLLDPARKKRPFFLYVPFNSPHAPIVPSAEWRGKSGINAYADYVMETDDAVARILDALDKAGLAENTLVFFTSDNGASPKANFAQLRAAGHDPSGGLRGHKADAWEGGHRVPCIVRWPGVVEPGSVSGELICHNHLLATCAEILGAKLPESAGPDSFSILPVLKGEKTGKPTHPLAIQSSIRGCFALREGNWKFIACKGSGGWSKGDDGKPAQLYDMLRDRAETRNLLGEKPELVARMKKMLEKAVRDGHTAPGKTGENDVPVRIYKTTGAKKKKRATTTIHQIPPMK